MNAAEVFALKEGQLVRVTILKSGYWKGIKTGRYLGIAKDGRIKVRVDDKLGLYNVRNVSEWHPSKEVT